MRNDTKSEQSRLTNTWKLKFQFHISKMPKVVSLWFEYIQSYFMSQKLWVINYDSFNMTIFWYGINPHINIPQVVSTCCVIGLSLYVVNVYRSVVGQPRRRLWWILIQNNDSEPRRSCYHIQMVLYQHKTTSSFEIYLKLYRWKF